MGSPKNERNKSPALATTTTTVSTECSCGIAEILNARVKPPHSKSLDVLKVNRYIEVFLSECFLPSFCFSHVFVLRDMCLFHLVEWKPPASGLLFFVVPCIFPISDKLEIFLFVAYSSVMC